MMRDDGELEGAYRLFSNPDVSPQAILGAHYMATARRINEATEPTIVVHDTTECCFPGDAQREGVHKISNGAKGLFVHVALAVARDGTPRGLLDLATHTRERYVESKRTREKRHPWERESIRWSKTVDSVVARLGASVKKVVHVMDREADDYLLFDALTGNGDAFVIRVCQNRPIVDPEHDFLREVVERIDATIERDVWLSRRKHSRRRYRSNQKAHPARDSRAARLHIGTSSVTIRRAGRVRRYTDTEQLTLNVVRVWEPDPPEGQAAIEWVLVTNLPMQTQAQLAAIVDVYRTRWTVEEFFKALKTGCAFERRQLESRHALENALAILAPIACRLLLLRTLAHLQHDAPAIAVLSRTELEVLRVISRRHELPRQPTVRDALLAVAGLGGFLKRNKVPGWQTIGLGFEELVQATVVWNAAKRA